ncbi:691_t:CDS:2 [Scutellospora calospora]|uniref:691_t:CDS:1 n=1 Tax=Scutellospora calospora TaxID=85575 RepID=A0ACA9LGV5_9GLOM|nr:691_t:CDS:2 [Scutellospora calospora]
MEHIGHKANGIDPRYQHKLGITLEPTKISIVNLNTLVLIENDLFSKLFIKLVEQGEPKVPNEEFEEIKRQKGDKGKNREEVKNVVNAQEWLEENYPDKEKYIPSIYINQQLEGVLDCSGENEQYGDKNFGKTREEITELDIREKALEGELDLSDFKNLEILKCSDNYLTQIPYLPNPEKMNSL